MRRLYVGGLSHTITQKDLKDRFGKFGEVEDVELRTRRDDEGVPYKTFGYININISEADLKKCLTVLNKSKWKGGILQIETAKESFLHRLAEERQATAEQQLQPAAEDKRQKMLDSLSKAGVENFTMKAAVPGTEIPGHKDWVVSKFGRVLPVMQLRCQKGNRARTVKYDPSKYSHNIRKLDRAAEDQHQHTPVTQLTWELQGGDDDISKKRRGEFPPFEPSRPKKSRTDVVNSQNTAGRASSKQTVASVSHAEARQVANGHEQPTNHRPAQRRWAATDSDVDSDEEIRRMAQAQNTPQVAVKQEVDEEKLEVVGLDYLVKFGKQQQKGSPDDEEENDYDSADTDELLAARKPPPPPPPPAQERLTTPTAEQLPKNNTDKKRNTKKKSKAEEEEDDSTDEEDDVTSRKPSSTQHNGDSGKPSKKKMKVLPVVKPPPSESDSDDEDEEEESESADCSSDSDYEAMFSNVTHLEISFADLKRLAEEAQRTTAPSGLGASSEQEDDLKSAPKKGITPEEILAALMEDSSGDERKKKKKKKRKAVASTPLPAFQGTSVLNEGSETEECQRRQEDEEERQVKKQKLDSEVPELDQRTTDGKTSTTVIQQKHAETENTSESSEEEEEEDEEEEEVDVVAPKVSKVVQAKAAVNSEKAATDSSSSSDDDDDDDDEEEEEEVKQTALTSKIAATDEPSSSSSSSEEEEDEQELIPAKDAGKAAPPPAPHRESSSSEETEEEEKVKPAPPRVLLGAKEEEELQRKANMRRLAAVQQRQKEAEEHKKLIQGALAKLDAAKPGAGKHIVFGSDDDNDDDDDEVEDEDKKQETSVTTKKTLFQDSQSEDDSTDDEASASENKTIKEKVGPKLFGGSEDEEEEDGDEEKDGSRFDIRPQFEGRAGQKLMALQSRFGTDERFRMDSRFLEEDVAAEEESDKKASVTEEEDALDEEKKKNLSILQSIIGTSQQTSSSKTASKAKTFRDVSALHYDPSKEEHAAFETKSEEPKESKSARRKKREEAQKLPEVSKEIYYDVSGDLKSVFGQTNDDTAGEEKMNWDKVEEEKEEEKDEEPTPLSSLLAADAGAEKETSSGFKFSFFGDDTEPESKETEEYKVESIEAPKVSWQHDSSSEEDEDEQEEDKEQSSITVKTTEEETPLKTHLFFFFRPEDSRLTEGPRLFYRSSHLEEQREQWEERRSALRQECRKKHKDARRKLKSSQKS